MITRNLILFVLALLPCVLSAQIPAGCKEEFFLKEITNVDSSFQVSKMEVIAGGDFIVCGASNISGGATGALMRVRPDGSVLWSKKYDLGNNSTFLDLLVLPDGNLALAGTLGSLWKVSPDGAVIWHRANVYPTVEYSHNIHIGIDEQGNIYTAGYFLENNLSFHDRISFRKFDSNGNLIFSKWVKGGGNMTVTYPNDMLVHNGSAYITGYFHNWYHYSGYLMKLNLGSGDLEWTRLYNFNDSDLVLNRIYLTSNGFLLTGRDNINVTDTSVLVETDFNGIPERAHYMEYSSMQRNYEEYTVHADGSVYFAVNTFNLTDHSMRALIGKINLNTGFEWSRRYDMYSGFARINVLNTHHGSLYFGGSAFPGLYSGYSFIGRMDLEGVTPCSSEDFRPAWGTGRVSVRDTLLFAYDKQMVPVAISPIVTHLALDYVEKCVVENLCDELTLNNDTIKSCLSNDTIAVEFSKTPGCLLGVIFEYDASLVKWVSTQGNVASFVPLRKGTSMIRAVMSGSCGELSDSLVVVYQPNKTLNLGNDTSFCTIPVVLSAPTGFASYTWNTGETTSSITINEAGTYRLTVLDACGNTQSDEIAVQQRTGTIISIGGDREICAGDTIHVTAPAGFQEYQWYPAPDLHMISPQAMWMAPRANTTIGVTASSADGCQFTGEMDVFVHNSLPLNIGPDSKVCQGSNVLLNGGAGFTQYRWNNGSHSPSISVSNQGLYVLEALSPQGCVSRDSISISVVDTPANFLKASYSFCVADPKVISVDDAFVEYVWSTGDTGNVLSVKTADLYTLKVTNEKGCTGSASTVVVFESCYKGMAYPNAFSPNNDGVNDTYKPVTGLPLQHYEFTIYNRWGQVVFHTKDISQAWNGRINGREAVSDTYTWKCVYMDDGKTMQVDKGIVVLIR